MTFGAPLLNLTDDEKRWNDYYDNPTDGRRGVIVRRYPADIVLDGTRRLAVVNQSTPRRARVYCVTWSGDVQALKVSIKLSTGEQLTPGGPVHLPLLCGAVPWSTLSVNAFLIPPVWPTYDPLAPAPAAQLPPAFAWVIEPNVVLDGNAQLIFSYELENPNYPIPVLSTGQPNAFNVQQVVHQWEFPGYEGGP